jgi:hypothetical protein
MQNKSELVKTVIFFFLLLFIMNYALGQPSGSNITYNVSETKTPAPAQSLNTSGGSFTTVILSSETQNLRWKAYAGNVTGVLTLDDSGNYSIYQWQLTTITGKVFATRNNSINWPNVQCASASVISTEETAMNHTTSNADSINSTFHYKIHKDFFVGTVPIAQSSCQSTFTWANDTVQTPSVTAPFQEVLLSDGASLVYTTFIDDNTQGFNFNKYDFQMIVAERGVGGYANTRYYFYMELQ